MDEDRNLLGKLLKLLDGAQRELALLREEVGDLRTTIEHQAAQIAWLKEESVRHDRNHRSLWAHVQEELARVFLWVDALGCKVLPKAVMLANEVAEKLAPSAIVPPHRLRARKQDELR